MAGTSLFNIVGEYQELYTMLTENTDDAEVEQVITDTLEAVKGELEVKAEGYIHVIQQMEMEAERAEQLEYEWGLKKKIRKDRIARLKNALKDALVATDNEGGLKAGDYTLKVAKNGGKAPLIIDKPDAVPDNMTKVIIEPDKDRIRQYLDEGNTCEWAHIAERGTHLSIK